MSWVQNREWLILTLILKSVKASRRRCHWSRALKNESELSKKEAREQHSRTKEG